MEMKARGAHIISVIEEGDEEIKSLSEEYIEVPKGIPSVLSPIPFAVPLQLLASKLATGLLELAGVPVLRQGNVIVLASMPLDVAEACSGIRSLLTLVTLAIIYGYLMETRVWVRVVLYAVLLALVGYVVWRV